MADSLWYPSVTDVIVIHNDIVSEYPETPSGVQNRGDIEFTLNHIEEGSFGSAPETVHEKAFHLLRLLVANHPFVDGTSVPPSTQRSSSTSSTIIGSTTTTKSERS